MSVTQNFKPVLELPTQLTDMQFSGMLGLGKNRKVCQFSYHSGIFTISSHCDDDAKSSDIYMPLANFFGIALKSEFVNEHQNEEVSLYLVCENPDLAIPVFHGEHTEKLLPIWYEWQDKHGLTAMVCETDGQIRDLVLPFHSLQRGMPQPRRQSRHLAQQRPRASRRDHFRDVSFTKKSVTPQIVQLFPAR